MTDFERKFHEASLILRAFAEVSGWRGSGPSDRDVFYCELCGEHDADSNKIVHSPTCPVDRAQKFLASERLKGER